MTSEPCHDRRPAFEDLTAHLRRDARRVTGPRLAILKVLQSHPHPLSNKEIFQCLPKGGCDLATVYRSLHLLEDMGLVARFDFGDGISRFEVHRKDGTGHHHHLVCTSCSAVVELDDCLAADWESRIAKENGFKAVTHRLEFFGLCPLCQGAEGTSNGAAPPSAAP